MAINSFTVARDNFALDQNLPGLAFPCNCCAHRNGNDSDAPCRTCDHNLNAMPDHDIHESDLFGETQLTFALQKPA